MAALSELPSIKKTLHSFLASRISDGNEADLAAKAMDRQGVGLTSSLTRLTPLHSAIHLCSWGFRR